MRKETLAKFSFGIIGLSILLRILGALFWTNTEQMTVFFFYNTFTRMEEIAFGVLLAIAFTEPEWIRKLSKFALPVFLVTYVSLLIVEVVTNPGIPHPAYGNVPLTLVGYTMASTFAAALIVTLITRDENSFIRRLFRNKALVFFGNHSYSMYLFHLPVGLILLNYLWGTGLRGWYMFVLYVGLVFGITIVISQITWFLLEKPMLGLKKYFEYKRPARQEAAGSEL
jgi:peptidoglycan/LPS O-acetylase OafA/YrhL